MSPRMLLAALGLTLVIAASAAAQTAPDPDRDALATAPDPLPEGENVSLVFDAAVADLAAVAASSTLPSTARPLVDEALAQLELARTLYHDLEAKPGRRFGKLFKALRLAQADLAESRTVAGAGADAASLAQLQTHLTSLARVLAGDFGDRGALAGLDRRTLDRAETWVARGDAYASAGAHSKAVGAYGKAFKTVDSKLKFDPARLDAELFSAFAGNVSGIAYVVAKNGVKIDDRAFGAARRSPDDGATSMTIDSSLMIASTSKPITAVGMLKVLEEHDISVDASIAPYLPGYWDVPGSVGDLTFRHLFTHRSGLNGFDASPGSTRCGSTYVNLKTCIELGIDTDDQVPFAYQNSNYAMMRVLIAMIEYGDTIDNLLPAGFCGLFESACDNAFATMTAQLTLTYMRCKIFDPMQLGTPGVAGCNDGPGVTPTSVDPTLAYSTVADTSPGWLTDDHSTNFGGFGWHMSAYELGQFFAYLRYSNDILGPTQRTRMDTGYLGWMDPANFGAWVQGTYGTYRAHGGDWFDNSSPRNEIHTCVMNYPDGYQVSLVINSQHGLASNSHQCHQMRLAYDNAWVPK